MTRYEVRWHIVGSDVRGTAQVLITPGYTTVDDIPAIIATARTGRPSDGRYLIIDETRELESYPVNDCPCCGIPVYGKASHGRSVTRVDHEQKAVHVWLCEGCPQGEECDTGTTWHCDGRHGHHCDGTVCEERTT